ncbi:hypothetical protein NHX12_012033 [Muraenolepis orangiensis]|uniref:Uncharacterized protein n=1 Tax=Muraenolepis orangiensis TaxID=630683 RepID=A0A9Q0DK20_9TELE|nr:hypothetical protein NHX12_012033 [Muraenolepis orangiensis]
MDHVIFPFVKPVPESYFINIGVLLEVLLASSLRASGRPHTERPLEALSAGHVGSNASFYLGGAQTGVG